MKKLVIASAVAASALTLSACGGTTATENNVAAADNLSDSYEDLADNTSNTALAEEYENTSDAIENTGESLLPLDNGTLNATTSAS